MERKKNKLRFETAILINYNKEKKIRRREKFENRSLRRRKERNYALLYYIRFVSLFNYKYIDLLLKIELSKKNNFLKKKK